jgi:hypothetical protein
MKLLVAGLVLAAACGSKSPSAATTPEAGGGTAVAALPDVPWEKLDHAQRIEFMKQKVVPTMKPIFQAHDANDFADFGCQTCHGDGAKEGHFDMPNPRLPKLNFQDMSKFKKADLQWMDKQVEPTMARMLGLPPYSKDQPEGFGCPTCHTIEGA